MPSENYVRIEGHAGKDAEIRYTQAGTAVASFSIATSEWQGEGKPERTEWHKCVAWEKLCREGMHGAGSIRKGDLVRVEGRLQTREYKDREGVTKYTTEIVARSVVNYGVYKRGETAKPADDYEVGDLGPALDELSPGD